MELQQLMVLIGIVVGLFSLLALSTYLNKKTVLPEGYHIEYIGGCDHCSQTTCSLNPGLESLKAEIKQELHKNKGEEVNCNA